MNKPVNQHIENETGTAEAMLRVSRGRACARGLIWSGLSVVLGLPTLVVFDRLDFGSVGLSSWFVDCSFALLLLPVALGAVLSITKGVGWLLLACWPGRTGVFANEQELTLCLGPFGTRRYDSVRLDVRYPFELLDEDADEASFEAFLPQQQQYETMLPRILHPDATEPIQWTILRVAKGAEKDLAMRLRHVCKLWQNKNKHITQEGEQRTEPPP